MTNLENTVVKKIMDSYNINHNQLENLIKATNKIGGCSFVSIKGYSSDKSDNTEIANQLINVGASYENMEKKDIDIYSNFDINTVDVDKFNYDSVDTGKLNLTEYKQAVKNVLSDALIELNQPKKRIDTSNDIWLNKVLVFNLNTMRLSIRGQQISKSIESVGTFKKVKSAPKTIAKKLIQKQANGKAQTLRRFAIDNIINFEIKDNTLIIG